MGLKSAGAAPAHRGVVHKWHIGRWRTEGCRASLLDMSDRPLPHDIDEVLRRCGGMADHVRLVAAGITTSRISRLVADGRLHRIARGCYVNRASYVDSDMWTRFRLRSRALALATGPDVHLSGWSAGTVAWDLPTIGRAPARPQAIRSRDNTRHNTRGEAVTTFGRVRTVDLADDHLTQTAGPDGIIPTATAGWTAVDLARLLPVPHGLVVVDRAARDGHNLRAALPSITGWLGAPRARWVVEQAQPNCETPLESLGRVPIYLFDLPLPVFNAWVGIDRPLYRVDELWPWHGVVGEADGAIKYNNRPDADDIVRQQQEREWILQRLGLRVVRYGWKLAHDHGELGRRYAAVLAERPIRDEPIRWWPDEHGTPRDWTPADQPSPGPTGLILPAGWNRAVRPT